MKTATILPQKFLHLAAEDDYHMALAHLIQAPGFEEYTEFFKKVGHSKDQFLMLDTGLIEGDPRPIDELVEKAAYLQADEMAIPDVFMNHTETLRESYDALQYIRGAGQYTHLTDFDIRVMGIPQGNSLEDWVACAKEMLTWPIDTIGIPKVLVHLEGGRGRLNALLEIQDILEDKEVHLLGCWETPLELKLIENATRAGVIMPVRGVDSAIAYAYARAGVRITDDERPEGAINFAAQHCDMDILEYNIQVWKEEAATLSPLEEVLKQKIHRLK